MKKEDIKELTTDELEKRIVEDAALYTKMKFNHTVTQLDNPMKIRVMRRDIARLQTELKARLMRDESLEVMEKPEEKKTGAKQTAKETKEKVEKEKTPKVADKKFEAKTDKKESPKEQAVSQASEEK